MESHSEFLKIYESVIVQVLEVHNNEDNGDTCHGTANILVEFPLVKKRSNRL